MDKIELIKDVLRGYFEYDDAGNPNPGFDADMAPQDAIDKIHDIVERI